MDSDKERTEIVISPLKANLLAFVYVLPVSAFFVWLFIRYFGKTRFMTNAIDKNGVFFMVIFIGIFLHELLHGIGWGLFTKNGFKSIKFGFSFKILSPYSHCEEVLDYWKFIFGVTLPAIILGILPIVLSFLFVKSNLLIYGIIFLFGAGGDLVVFFNILKYPSENVKIIDHPSKIGCILIKKGDAESIP